jgi:sulfopyruvate decarboxylase TPP-binding subunit
MKNLICILILVFATTFSTHAQKKRGRKGSEMTTAQQATLKVKKMTLALDLNADQQKEIMALITRKIDAIKKMRTTRKENRKSEKRPNADAIFAMKNKHLDAQIMMKNKMQKILTAAQFQKFEKIVKTKKRMAVKKMKRQKRKRGSRR